MSSAVKTLVHKWSFARPKSTLYHMSYSQQCINVIHKPWYVICIGSFTSEYICIIVVIVFWVVFFFKQSNGIMKVRMKKHVGAISAITTSWPLRLWFDVFNVSVQITANTPLKSDNATLVPFVISLKCFSSDGNTEIICTGRWKFGNGVWIVVTTMNDSFTAT